MLTLRSVRRLYSAVVDTGSIGSLTDISTPQPINKAAQLKAAQLKASKQKEKLSCSTTSLESVSVTQLPALEKLKAERDPEKLFQLFKANSCNRLVVENRFAFEDTIFRLAGAGRFDYIEELLEHQKVLPQGRREGFVIRIIMLYAKAGMTDHAIKTFQDMHLFGCCRTVKSFNATLKALSLTHTFELIHSFFYEIPGKYGIQPDLFSFNLIIRAFCGMGCLDSAYLIMVDMERLGIKPDVITYTTLISAFYRSNRREIADGLWNLMVLRRCYPNIATFNVRIQYLINKGRPWLARDLMRKMAVLGIMPDELTFNMVIKGFCKVGSLDMAKRIYDSLHSKGCKPNIKIYQTMIHYLCEAGEYDSAFKLSKDALNRNWFPSIESICKLLEGLMKSSKDRNAREIVKLLRRRIPPYSAEELKKFQDIYSRGRE